MELLEEKLKKHIVRFIYRKSDGTARVAIGTLLPHLIPSKAANKAEELRMMLRELVFTDDITGATLLSAKKLLDAVEPKPSTRPSNPDLFNYYDLSLGEWRSFKKENFMDIISVL